MSSTTLIGIIEVESNYRGYIGSTFIIRRDNNSVYLERTHIDRDPEIINLAHDSDLTVNDVIHNICHDTVTAYPQKVTNINSLLEITHYTREKGSDLYSD